MTILRLLTKNVQQFVIWMFSSGICWRLASNRCSSNCCCKSWPIIGKRQQTIAMVARSWIHHPMSTMIKNKIQLIQHETKANTIHQKPQQHQKQQQQKQQHNHHNSQQKQPQNTNLKYLFNKQLKKNESVEMFLQVLIENINSLGKIVAFPKNSTPFLTIL